MQYHPSIHHRRPIRLKGYDYSQKGAYFITICVQNRKWLFGTIINGEMALNDAGKMVEKWYYELENKFLDIKCDEFICMPDHIHFIIITGVDVGADLRVCPNNEKDPRVCPNRPNLLDEQNNSLGEHTNTLGEHTGSPLHRIVQWFKTMTTNDYIKNVKNNGWQRFENKLWQRNYYEHIIRDENDFNRIREYIINNPLNWKNKESIL